MSLKWLPSCALAPQPKLPDDARFMPPLKDVRSRLRAAINRALARFVSGQVLPDECVSHADAGQGKRLLVTKAVTDRSGVSLARALHLAEARQDSEDFVRPSDLINTNLTSIRRRTLSVDLVFPAFNRFPLAIICESQQLVNPIWFRVRT